MLVLASCASAQCPYGDGSQTNCGDCDIDGQVTILDALAAAQIALDLWTPIDVDAWVCCDVVPPFTGSPDILDALAIMQASLGLPVLLMC